MLFAQWSFGKNSKQVLIKVSLASLCRSVIRAGSSGKVLLMFDGYDNYVRGTNDDIDSAIENTIGDCFLIVMAQTGSGTGNSDGIEPAVRKSFDAELKIAGLDKNRIRESVTSYLEDETKAQTLLQEAIDVREVFLLISFYRFGRANYILKLTLVTYLNLPLGRHSVSLVESNTTLNPPNREW